MNSLLNSLDQSHQQLARTFRAESGKILAVLLQYCQDIDLAEDALQAAFCSAAELWPREGAPQNPSGWLYTVAKRKLIDVLRRNNQQDKFQHQLEVYRSLYESTERAETAESDFTIPEERLRLIFTCCHPALSAEARVALTLKTLCGLSVREIARAYLASESTMERRLSRAKGKIRDAGISYEIPNAADMTERLDSVLSVIYLIYNESYSAFEGQTLTRDDFATEAIRLADLLHALLPKTKVTGLLALLLLHDARRPARSAEGADFISLKNQNRQLWDQDKISRGVELLECVVRQEAVSDAGFDVYTVQAAISALHCKAASWEQTDWRQIEQLYRTHYQLDASPVVLLNHAIALMSLGLHEQAFAQINSLEKVLEKYQPFYVARATIASALGENAIAVEDYKSAIKLSNNRVERAHLEQKLQLSLEFQASTSPRN